MCDGGATQTTVVTVELHKIALANVTLQCYKGICFADLTQNWWHIQIYIHSEVNSLQYIVFSEFCCLTWFKALNRGSGRFPPCAEYFMPGLHDKRTKQILTTNKIALQNVWVQILLRPYNAEFTYFAEFWVTCYIPWAITSQNYEWKRESKLKCHFVIIYSKEHIPFSCKMHSAQFSFRSIALS